MSDAQNTDISAAKGNLGTVEVGDETIPIISKPDALLLSELARTGSGDPEAFGVIAEFFEITLGKETYRAFKKAVYADDEMAEDEEALMGKLQEVLEQTMGRPTK